MRPGQAAIRDSVVHDRSSSFVLSETGHGANSCLTVPALVCPDAPAVDEPEVPVDALAGAGAAAASTANSCSGAGVSGATGGGSSPALDEPDGSGFGGPGSVVASPVSAAGA
jgi:hypothetical protein